MRKALLVAIAAAHVLLAQSAPKFEVASIKLCKGDGRGGGGDTSPVTFDLPCMPLRFFISLAYIISNSRPGISNPLLEGGPAWIDSDRYQINAKSAVPVSKATMNGPMLRALLEERFQLKVRPETREVPVWALTMAKGGLRARASDGTSCAVRDPAQPYVPPGEMPWCGLPRSRKDEHKISTDLPGATMAQFVLSLGLAGRTIVDRTGVAGTFDFHLEYAPDAAELSDDQAAPSLDSGLGKLGLRLEKTKDSRAFLVIDRVERPSEN